MHDELFAYLFNHQCFFAFFFEFVLHDACIFVGKAATNYA